jgi:hypothetical protein
MRRQQRALSRRHIRNKDIRIRPFGLLLRIDDVFPILRPDRPVVAFVLRRAASDVLYFAQHRVIHINFIRGGILRFHFIRQIAPVRRPRRTLFRDFARLRQIHHFARLRGYQENVPLLIAVIIRLIGDPFPVRRPRRSRLPLVAHRQLHRPSAFRRNDP